MRIFIKKSERIGLAVMERENIPEIYAMINDPEVNRFLRTPSSIWYLSGEYEWYDNLCRDANRNRVFPVINLETDQLLGLIGLHNIDFKNGFATVGYMYGKTFWGNGFATEALKLLMDYSFNVLNLRKLIASVFDSNIASKKVLENNGFNIIGKYTKHSYAPDAGYQDEILFEFMNTNYHYPDS